MPLFAGEISFMGKKWPDGTDSHTRNFSTIIPSQVWERQSHLESSFLFVIQIALIFPCELWKENLWLAFMDTWGDITLWTLETLDPKWLRLNIAGVPSCVLWTFSDSYTSEFLCLLFFKGSCEEMLLSALRSETLILLVIFVFPYNTCVHRYKRE